MHFREIPFLRLLAPLCAGVIAAETAPGADTVVWITVAASAVVLTGLTFRKKYFSDPLFGIILFVLITAAGYLLYSNSQKRLSTFAKSEQIFLLKLSEYPDKKSNSWSFRARIMAAGTDTLRSGLTGSMLLYCMDDSLTMGWHPGDRIMIRTTPLPVTNNGNPCEFNYKRYMEGQGIRFIGFFSPGDLLEHSSPDRRSLREISLVLARKMTGAFAAAGLQGEDLGLVTALTIGEKDMLDRDLLTSFSRTGAMHIMAVSGLHVGMISLMMSWLLFFMRRRINTLRVMIILLSLWAFAFITGLSPSVLRATIMFSFLQTGTLLRRQGNSMNILLASAFLLITARPAVLFEAGFQLSYIAVAFIILFYEPLYRILKLRNKVTNWFWQMTAVSIVAQAGTFAMTVRLFNIFPLLFLLSNLIIIPVSFAVLMLALLLVIFSAVSPVAALFGTLLKWLSHLTIGYTHFAASLPHGVIENIGLTGVESLLLTLVITLLMASILRVGKLTLKPFLIAASLFVTCGLIRNISESRKEGPLVYNIKGKPLTAYQSGKVLTLSLDDEVIPAEVRKHAATRGLKIEVRQRR
ncbi:MAG TPA: ComEC/Rec2 family competence protein [Bacteroidales bacterium]|nr:ComEC/Rec2 family competence protein [Bacteroidales bacterium]